MAEANMEDITEKQFLAFESVQRYGRWNMFDPLARTATGLDKNTYFGVILHYNELKEKYKENIDSAWKGTEKVMKKYEEGNK